MLRASLVDDDRLAEVTSGLRDALFVSLLRANMRPRRRRAGRKTNGASRSAEQPHRRASLGRRGHPGRSISFSGTSRRRKEQTRHSRSRNARSGSSAVDSATTPSGSLPGPMTRWLQYADKSHEPVAWHIQYIPVFCTYLYISP